MTKTITKTAAVIILAIGLLTNAAAQKVTDGNGVFQSPFAGMETAKGTFERQTDKFYGNSFVLNSFGEWETQHFTVSLDYLCEQCGKNSHFPVTGGAWSMVIFRENVYVGTLYGKVSGGTIDVVTNHNGEPGFRQMRVNLQTTGGLGRFARRGSGNIGVFEAITDAVSNQTTGYVNLNYLL